MIRTLAFAMLAMLSGCASGGGITPGQEFSLDVGQQATLPDASTLRYAGIANDSRCPVNVTCIRAGDADVLFDHVAKGGAAQRVTLNTERTTQASLGPWQLHLGSLAAGERPRVTLRVEAN